MRIRLEIKQSPTRLIFKNLQIKCLRLFEWPNGILRGQSPSFRDGARMTDYIPRPYLP